MLPWTLDLAAHITKKNIQPFLFTNGTLITSEKLGG